MGEVIHFPNPMRWSKDMQEVRVFKHRVRPVWIVDQLAGDSMIFGGLVYAEAPTKEEAEAIAARLANEWGWHWKAGAK